MRGEVLADDGDGGLIAGHAVVRVVYVVHRRRTHWLRGSGTFWFGSPKRVSGCRRRVTEKGGVRPPPSSPHHASPTAAATTTTTTAAAGAHVGRLAVDRWLADRRRQRPHVLAPTTNPAGVDGANQWRGVGFTLPTAASAP